MAGARRTSGDLLADRRFAYAEALAADGQVAAAGDLLEQTIERVPDWVPAWLALGSARAKLGLTEGAMAAFAQARRLDRTGVYGAILHHAHSQGDPTPPAMPPAYVAALFDDYAARFDQHLVETLGYRGPGLIAAALTAAVGARRFGRAIDLGCGTGLMALPIRAATGHLAGVDLSSLMIAEAERKGLYDQLIVGDILQVLAGEDRASIDLLTAADVFAYLGPLGPVAHAAARVLRSGGVAAFTVQHGEAELRLGPDLRFSHSTGHVATALADAGLDLLLCQRAVLRREAGADVPGLVVVARKP